MSAFVGEKLNRAQATAMLSTGELKRVRGGDSYTYEWHSEMGMIRAGCPNLGPAAMCVGPFTVVRHRPVPGWEECSWDEAKPMGFLPNSSLPVRACLAINGPETGSVVSAHKDAGPDVTWLRPVEDDND